jgi:hypothetical protein
MDETSAAIHMMVWEIPRAAIPKCTSNSSSQMEKRGTCLSLSTRFVLYSLDVDVGLGFSLRGSRIGIYKSRSL